MIKIKYLIAVLVFLILISFLFIGFYKKQGIGKYIENEKTPDIFPDYTSVVIPPNIAPLNFSVEDKGKKYYVTIYSDNSRGIKILSKSGKIVIPKRKWKKLLDSNRGKSVYIDVYTKNTANKWEKFSTIINKIAADEMDSYVAFRLINPAYILWEKMGIYQRDIESYSMKPVLLNRTTEKNCMNCHTFCSNSPDKMILHLRSKPSGTILYNNGTLQMLNTGTQFTMSSCVMVFIISPK